MHSSMINFKQKCPNSAGFHLKLENAITIQNDNIRLLFLLFTVFEGNGIYTTSKKLWQRATFRGDQMSFVARERPRAVDIYMLILSWIYFSQI